MAGKYIIEGYSPLKLGYRGANGDHGSRQARPLIGRGVASGPEDDVEHDAVVVGVAVVAVVVPVGGVQVELNVADYEAAVLGSDDGVQKVGTSSGAGPAGIEHPEASAVLGT